MGHVLGIDIGGTKVAVALGDSEGRVLARARRPTETTGRPADDVARMAGDARRLLDEHGVALSEVSAVGVAAPGPLDAQRAVVIAPPNLPGWTEVPLAALLEAELGRPVVLENDANAAALAEWRFGAGRGCDHLVYLTVSTGLGGGLILGGRLHRGTGGAGEIGHMPVEWDGEPCGCGQRGCLEAYVGGAAWTRRLREIAPAESRVLGLAGAREQLTPEHVIAAARERDPFALAELARFNEYLARGIAQVVWVLAPQRVVLGTIAVAAGEELCFAPVRERVRARLWPELARAVEIVPAALGDELAGYAGLCAAWGAG